MMILNFLQIGQNVFNLHIVWVLQEKPFKDFEVHFQLEMYQYCQKLDISVKMFLTKVCQVHAFWMDITGTLLLAILGSDISFQFVYLFVWTPE